MCIYYSCRINPWHRLQYLEPNIQIILMSAVIFALNSHSSPQWHIYCFHLWHINTLHFIYFSFLFTREKKEADFNPWYQPLHFWQDPNPRSKSPSPDHHSRPPKKQLIHSSAHHGHRIYSITQATKSQCSCAPSNIQIFSLFNELLQNTELLNAISLSSFTSAGMAMMGEFFMDNRRQAMKKGRDKKKKSFFLLLKNF